MSCFHDFNEASSQYVKSEDQFISALVYTWAVGLSTMPN
jgi:hypothetical protein